jgi:hypothetical protein
MNRTPEKSERVRTSLRNFEGVQSAIIGLLEDLGALLQDFHDLGARQGPVWDRFAREYKAFTAGDKNREDIIRAELPALLAEQKQDSAAFRDAAASFDGRLAAFDRKSEAVYSLKDDYIAEWKELTGDGKTVDIGLARMFREMARLAGNMQEHILETRRQPAEGICHMKGQADTLDTAFEFLAQKLPPPPPRPKPVLRLL